MSCLRVSAAAKFAVFVVFAWLLSIVVWPEALCWIEDSGRTRQHVVTNRITEEKIHITASLDRSAPHFRKPTELCIQTNISNLICDEKNFNQDELCFGFGKIFVVWVVQCVNALLLLGGCLVVSLKRAKDDVNQVDLAIPVIITAFSLSIFWLWQSLAASWFSTWYNSGWVVPSYPLNPQLVHVLCSVAVICEVFDFVVLYRAFRNKLMMEKRC